MRLIVNTANSRTRASDGLTSRGETARGLVDLRTRRSDEGRVLASGMRANIIILASALAVLFTFPTAHAGEPTPPPPPDLCDEPVYSVTGVIYSDLFGQTKRAE